MRCVAGTPIACDDGLFCNGAEACDEDSDACVAGPPACNDGLFCNGVETCDEDNDSCLAGEAPCDDENVCTTDTCDEDADSCGSEPIAGCCASWEDCDDGLYCNGAESCDLSTNTCLAGEPPCPADDLFCNGVESCDEDTDALRAGHGSLRRRRLLQRRRDLRRGGRQLPGRNRPLRRQRDVHGRQLRRGGRHLRERAHPGLLPGRRRLQ